MVNKLNKLKHFILFWSIFFLQPVLFIQSLVAQPDLEGMSQDFVLGTKKIDIPGYPTAFNPSVIRWNGSILMSFRARDSITGASHLVGFVWVDEDFNLISEPQLLDISEVNPYLPEKLQDVRLVSVGGELYAVYNNVIGPIQFEIRRMFIAKIRIEGTRFSIERNDALLNFEGAGDFPREKSWAPFEYEGKLFLAYSLDPHLIFQPLHGTSFCKTIVSSRVEIKWDWGQLRGGTPALLEDNEYLAFFHSSKEMRSAHSAGKSISHYFIGAYFFSAQPPFNITRLSPEPIIANNFYSGPAYETWKPLRAIFPCGYIKDDNFVWITYGKQDHELWVVKLDKKGLFDSLRSIK